MSKKVLCSCLVLLIFGVMNLSFAEQLKSPPIVVTYKSGEITLQQFEDWMSFMDLMYPIPNTQFNSRQGWDNEIYRLAKTQARVLLRNLEKDEFPNFPIPNLEESIERLQDRYTRLKLIDPEYQVKYQQWNQELENYYHKVKLEQFKKPTSYEFRHIFVNTNPDRGGRSEEEAQARIQQIKAALTGGETFEAVAKKYSDSKPSRRGNTIGPVLGNDLPEGFGEILEPLFVGEVSSTFKTKNGYEIVQLISRSPLTFVPFPVAKEELMKTMPPPDVRYFIKDCFEASNIPLKVFYPLKKEKLDEYDENTVLYSVGESEYRLGEMFNYFKDHPKMLNDLIVLNFAPEDIDFEKFVGLEFYDPKGFNGWIRQQLDKEKIIQMGLKAGLYETPEYKRYLDYFYEIEFSKYLGGIYSREKLMKIERNDQLRVNPEALKFFIEEYLKKRNLSY